MKLPSNSIVIAAAMVIGSAFLVFAAVKEHSTIDPNKCTNCAACVKVCPDDAIFVTKVNGKAVHVIDINKCTNCGACAEECEVNAIYPDTTDLAALEKQAKQPDKKKPKKKPGKKGSK